MQNLTLLCFQLKMFFHDKAATLTQLLSLAGTVFDSDSHWLATLFLLGLVGRGGRVGAKNSSGSSWNRVSSPPLAPNCAPATSAIEDKRNKGCKENLKDSVVSLLKEPRCEIFNHSYFHDFYTIKNYDKPKTAKIF